MENWKVVKEFPNYEVSDMGRLRNAKNKKEITGTNSLNYRRVKLTKNGTKFSVLIHRLVASEFIENPEGKPFVDHINRIKDDNRKENLRWSTNSENQGNTNKRQGSSIYKGVWAKSGKWLCTIQKDKKTRYLGTYETEEEAGRAYDLKALEFFGQFAKLNFPLNNYI